MKERITNSKIISYKMKSQPSSLNKTRVMKHKNKKALNCVISNLISCLRKGERLIYSRDKFMVAFNGISNSQIMSAVDFLVSEGLVVNTVGTSSIPVELRSPSILDPTSKFVEMFSPLLDDTLPNPLPAEEVHYKQAVMHSERAYLDTVEVVELRDLRKSPKLYRNTLELRVMQDGVRALNLVNSRHTFLSGVGEEITNVYVRIFSRGDFALGGRWYRAGILHLYNKTEKARLDVTIDGSSVVEVDFSCLHFRIVAAMFGIDEDSVPMDLYTEPLKRLVPEEDWADYDSKTDRNIIKLAINILFNAGSSLSAATGAIRNVLRGLTEEEKKESRISSAKATVDLILECYPDFSPYMRGAVDNLGLVLQRCDSDIAERVVGEFVSKGKPILPIHDSFLVKEEDLDLLLNSMGNSFREQLGVDFIVPCTVEYKLNGKVVEQHVLL